MCSYPEYSAPVLDGETFAQRLLQADRPGAEKILAFYDSRVDAICRDGRLLYIPLDDHLCHRGDGLFESFNFRDNKIFAFNDHLARLKRGADVLGLKPPHSWERLESLVLETARASGKSHGDLRLFLGRGAGGFGVSPAECPVASLYIAALETSLPSQELYEAGLCAFSSSVPPKQGFLARIKTVSYVPNVLMSAEAVAKNCPVAVSFDSEGNLAESAIANIAIVDNDGVFRYPVLDSILPGTTLLAAIRLAAGRMPALEGPVSKREVQAAREILLFTSSTLCVPITVYDQIPVGMGDQAGSPGPVAAWLKDALLDYMLAHGKSFR